MYGSVNLTILGFGVFTHESKFIKRKEFRIKTNDYYLKFNPQKKQMCGIWAVIGKMLQERQEYKQVKPRGPDNTTTYQDDSLLLVFHRLAIHDKSVLGIQPFFHADDTTDYFLLCNGEIYNEPILRKSFHIQTSSSSDCSILLPLFLKLDKNFDLLLSVINGEYAILLLMKDRQTNHIQFFAGTDPLSVRPLFFLQNPESVVFSSLLKGFSRQDTGVHRLTQTEFIEGTYHDGNLQLECKEKSLFSSTFKNLNICQVLTRCVEKRLSSDRPLGCLLSGGLDSSLVAAIAARELHKEGKKLRTFSIGMDGSPDLEFARKVASHIGSDHTEFIMTEEEGIAHIKDVIWAIESWDTTTIRASIPQYLLAKKISQTTNVKVLLNGDGADECQMGYLYFHKAPSVEEAVEERNRLLGDIHLFDGLRVDRCLTNFGLEARTPFLDIEFVHFTRDLSGNSLLPASNKNIEKFLIRNSFHIHYPNLLPDDVLWRTKEAFSDGVSSAQKSWFQTLKESVQDETEYYKNVFKELFGEKTVIPYRWMPRWTNTTDPSARTLDFYPQQGSF